jgi:hypothetical protein
MYGKYGSYNNELYMLYDKLCSQIDKIREIKMAETPL